MKIALFRFYAELNDFLPEPRRAVGWPHMFKGRVAVKDMIETLGIPHTEVDLILVNGQSVGFDHLVKDGDRISVYPMFESIDITPLLRVRPKPLRRVAFVLDVHLGVLARYLRLLGYDSLFRNDYDDQKLARISVDEERILLTKDRGLLKRSMVTHGYCVRHETPKTQVREIVERFDLRRHTAPFTRCMTCNGILGPVSKAEILALLPEKTRSHHEEFSQCRNCHKVYWKGSHYQALSKLVETFLKRQ